ncbi:MAG: hypothetical protein K8L91_28220, partial [Anaerolineae bacterium]|nr:hypothetical protein [Anaerolineae bacterium]
VLALPQHNSMAMRFRRGLAQIGPVYRDDFATEQFNPIPNPSPQARKGVKLTLLPSPFTG